MNYEKLEKLLKTAFSLTLLMAVFSTGMTAATIANSDAGISIWKPIGQGLLIMGPIVLAEWYGYRYCKKKADVIREQREKEEKEQEKGKIASQLYDIFAKYYDNEKQSNAV